MGLDMRFLVGLVLLGVGAGSVTVGCEARVSLGAQCETRSDCPEPFVCRQGRCRVECREARDCNSPLECIVEGIANAGGCRVPEDGACSRNEDCAGELVCEGSVCVQPCTDHSECAVAQVCNGRGCVRNTMIGDCDVLSGSGCDDGERCGILGMRIVDEITGEVTDTRAPACIALAAGEVRDSELGDACDANPETPQQPCRDGLTCVDGRCLRWCLFDHDTDAVDSNCGPGSQCVLAYSGARAPVTCGFCTEGCHPGADGASSGCPEGRVCGVVVTEEGVVYSQCGLAAEVDCTAEPMAEGCLDRPCTATGQCAAGLDCEGDLAAMSATCIERCEQDVHCAETSHCDVSSPRLVLVADGTTREIGVCVPD